MKRIVLLAVGFFLAGATSVFCGTPGTLKWSRQYEPYRVAPAIGRDGTLYIAGGYNLRALNPDNGDIIWSYGSNGFGAAPVLLPDRGICVIDALNYLRVINPDGTLRWSKFFGGGSIHHEVAVSGDGHIFVPFGNTLYCFSPAGDTIWTYAASESFTGTVSPTSPVIGHDGAIYLACQTPRTFYAVNIDGTLKWRQTYPAAAGNAYDNDALLGMPSVGAAGSIYVGDSKGYLREIDPVTGVRVREWAGSIDRSPMTCQSAIPADGYNVIGCTNSVLYGFHPTTGDFQRTFFAQGATGTTPAIGTDGTIYFGVSWQTTSHTYYFYALNPDFTVRWTYLVGREMVSSPVLGPDGTAYIGTKDGYLYAIHTENAGYQENSPYPRFRHDNANSGNSMNNSFLRCQPGIFDFGSVNLGAEAVKTFTLTNISGTPYTLGQFEMSSGAGSGAGFSLAGDCSGQAIAPGQTLEFSIAFRPLLNGRQSASVKIPFNDKLFYAGVFGIGGGAGLSSLVAVAYDGSNGQALPGADITVNAVTLATDDAGECLFSPLAPGVYTVAAGKDGYSPHEGEAEVPADSNTRREIILYPAGFTEPTVTGISSKHAGRVFYIDGVSFSVKHTANIDWAGHTPGLARFITPKGVFEQAADGNAVSRTFNMGADFGPGGTLKVQAVSSDGALSEQKEAECTVIGGIPLFPLTALDAGAGFSYASTSGLNWNLFNQGVDGASIPADIPFFGGNPVLLKLIPTVSAEVTCDGSASVELQFQGLQAEKAIDSGKLAGFSFSMYPLVSISGRYYTAYKGWDWDGYVGMHGEAGYKKSWPFVVWVGPAPVPMYAKASISLSVDALLGIVNLDPFAMNGKLSLGPYVRGSLGAGVDELLAVEGWIGGGLDLGLQWPGAPTLEELGIYLNGGFTVYALLYTWEDEVLRWDWSLISGQAVSGEMPAREPASPRVLSRDYLEKPGYALFSGGGDPRLKTVQDQAGGATVKYATLEADVFPHSEPAIFSAGAHLYATWLYDDPARSSLNRTVLVFSSYDGTSWSAPQPVADDGTADFHPDLIVFDDGWAAVTWENAKTALPDGASFEDMKGNLEICVSLYNPDTPAWSAPHALTDNAYFDRSPKTRGYNRDNLVVTWVANEAGHVTGNTVNPNRVYSSIWNGSAWAAPELVVNTADYPVFKKPLISYDFAYVDTQWGSGAFFCLDMDEDTSTDTDREIYRVFRYSRFDQWPRWDTPWRMTNDTLADGSVRSAWTTTGSIFYWLKGNAFYHATPNVTSGTLAVTFEERSSNLASFRFAGSAGGRAAICWAEPSEYSSDLWAVFYDPALAVWGRPQQLTFDAQMERAADFAFYGEETLVGLYDRVEIEIVEQARLAADGRVVSAPVRLAGATDLALLAHTVGTDIALRPGSLAVNPTNPACGSVADLSVTVMNAGNTAHQGVPVSFYAGEPGAGGVLIAALTIPSVLLPGEEKTVSAEWSVPAVSAPVSVYAVADLGGVIAGDPVANNTLHIDCVLPDIEAVSLVRRNIAGGLFSLTGTVRNTGSLATGEFAVEIRRDSPWGPLLYQGTLDNLEPKRTTQVSCLWDTAGASLDNTWLYLVADPPGIVADFNRHNNTSMLGIDLAGLRGDLDADGLIGLADVILCQKMIAGCSVTVQGQSCAAPYTERLAWTADLNLDLGVDILDALCLLRKVLGLD